MKKDRFLRRMLMLFFSVPIMSVGVVLLEQAGFGNGPFNGMCIALSHFFSLPLGNLQLCVNLALFVLMLLYKRERIWLGTIWNAMFLGYSTQLMVWLWDRYLPATENMTLRIVFLALGIATLGLACSLYFIADEGIAPFDALAFILQEHLPGKIPFFACRITTDMACVIVCFLAGGVLGVGTVLDALCLGPFISFFNTFVSQKLLYGRTGKPEDAKA